MITITPYNHKFVGSPFPSIGHHMQQFSGFCKISNLMVEVVPKAKFYQYLIWWLENISKKLSFELPKMIISSISSKFQPFLHYTKKKKKEERWNWKWKIENWNCFKGFKFQLVPPKNKKGKRKVTTFLYLVWICSQIHRRKIKDLYLNYDINCSHTSNEFKCISSLKCMHWNLNWK
jgi:hypothetical protein